MKIFSTLPLFLFLFVFQGASCQEQVGPISKLRGPEDKVELVFFYKKDATPEQKELFENNVLHTRRDDGKGYSSQEGVVGEFFVRNADYQGYAIEFYPQATPEQRENLKKRIESSPIVHRVYENVVPNDIDDL